MKNIILSIFQMDLELIFEKEFCETQFQLEEQLTEIGLVVSIFNRVVHSNSLYEKIRILIRLKIGDQRTD